MHEMKNFLEEHFKNVNKLEDFREYEDDITLISRNGENRDAISRDYARAIYSSSFRRQQGKMQLLAVNSKEFHRNRLTHSFEVAQIARGIVDRLESSYNDSSKADEFRKMSKVVETASLIHDIGNPPFGHHGERVLNKLAPNIGFEGNAQGIRILRKIEKKSPQINGLNLTLRVLAAIIKYNVKYAGENGPSKFLYEDDFWELNFQFKIKGVALRTIDVQIVDLADEIAYCAHDLEDALASNYFTIDEFLFLLKQSDENSYKIFNEWVNKAKDIAMDTKGSDFVDFDFYFRRELLSIIVNELIEDINVISVDEDFVKKTGTTNGAELGFEKYKFLAVTLKKTIFKGVIRSDDILLYENVGTKIINSLYKLFMDEDFNRGGQLMPVEYRWNEKDESDKQRKVLDYISGMMDTYAIELYEKFFGEDPFKQLYDEKGDKSKKI